MSWLDALQRRAQEARQPPTPPPLIARPAKPKPDIVSFWVQTRRPDYEHGDQGNVEPGYFYVADGVLVICDQNGKPTGPRQPLGPSDEPRAVAGRLRLEEWRKSRNESDFNRPLPRAPHSWY